VASLTPFLWIFLFENISALTAAKPALKYLLLSHLPALKYNNDVKLFSCKAISLGLDQPVVPLPKTVNASLLQIIYMNLNKKIS